MSEYPVPSVAASASASASAAGAVRPRPRVVVVGAGAAGLTAARLLHEFAEVVVLDKGRGVGGRMATRRIGAATFDHGAQFVTTHSAAFAQIVGAWADAGVAAEWYRGQVGPDGVGPDGDGHVRWRGTLSMNAVAKHLADGIDVRRSVRVAGLAPDADAGTGGADGWRLVVDDDVATTFTADAVVVTSPVPQTLALFDAGGSELDPADRAALEAIAYEPCAAVMLPLTAPSELPAPGACAPLDGPIAWLADNAAKGISAQPALTIHASPQFSSETWDAEPAEVITALAAAAGIERRRIGEDAQVHRWRYARPTVLHPHRSLTCAGLPPVVCAGDAFGGAKVEGAVLSGIAAASAVRDLLA